MIFVHQVLSAGDAQALTAVEGRTGEVLFSVDSPWFGSAHFTNHTPGLAAADVDADGFPEIFVTRRSYNFV